MKYLKEPRETVLDGLAIGATVVSQQSPNRILVNLGNAPEGNGILLFDAAKIRAVRPGATLQFRGVLDSYTAEPAMLTFVIRNPRSDIVWLSNKSPNTWHNNGMDQTSIPPHECAHLDEIRAGMDAIDREIVSLITRRVAYVRKAAEFKTSSANVAAPDRVAAVLKTRRQWAEAAGLNGEVIEGFYRDLVAYCVSEEHKQWEANHTGGGA